VERDGGCKVFERLVVVAGLALHYSDLAAVIQGRVG
jgi:hypothetical protein